MYKFCLFSSLLLLLSFSLLFPANTIHRPSSSVGVSSTHVLQSAVCSGPRKPRARDSLFLPVFPVLHVAFETIRSVSTNKRRQLERLGKCRQHLLFVRFFFFGLPSAAPSHSMMMNLYKAMLLLYRLLSFETFSF